MAGPLGKRFQVLDVAITIVAIWLVATIAWKFILKPDTAPTRLSIPVNLAGVDFRGSAETLQLVLQRIVDFVQ